MQVWNVLQAGPLRASLGPGRTTLTHGARYRLPHPWGITGPLWHCRAQGSLPLLPLSWQPWLHAARWKYRTQKIAKNLPYGHHRTTLWGCTFATKACIDIGKKLLNSSISSTCPHNMLNFGPSSAEIGLPVWGTQWVLRVGFVTAPTSLNGCQPNSTRCLAVSWAGTLYIHF